MWVCGPHGTRMGRKRTEGTFKDGKKHGLVTMWHENGQKEREYTFNDDKEISKKEWDRDGNPK